MEIFQKSGGSNIDFWQFSKSVLVGYFFNPTNTWWASPLKSSLSEQDTTGFEEDFLFQALYAPNLYKSIVV